VNVVPDRSSIRAFVDLASRAPSVHNTQPWRWVFDGGSLALHADVGRALPVVDPNGRQVVISCGAALHHLTTVARAFRWNSTVAVSRSTRAGDPLARVAFTPGARPQSPDFALLEAVTRRRSDRRSFGAVPNNSTVSDVIGEIARSFGVVVTALPADTHEALAAASHHSAAVRRYDWTYQAELRWWAGHSFVGNGIPAESRWIESEMPDTTTGRVFPPGRATVSSDAGPSGPDRALVVVIGTAADNRYEWVQSGRALSAVVLEMTALGLATCPLTHLTEETASRAVVDRLSGSDALSQILIRIGTAPAGSGAGPTPRRPVSEVLTGA